MKQKSRSKELALSILDDVKKSNIAELTGSSFRSWYTNWKWIILSVFIDFAFLISVASVITLIQFTLLEHLEQLMILAGEATSGLLNIYNQTAQVTGGLNSLGENLTFQYHLNIIFKQLGIMIVSVFILFIIFQSLSWYISHRMASKKPLPFWRFIKNFTLLTIPFYFLSILWIFLSIKLLFSIKMSITPLFGEDFLNFLFIMCVLVTWYFGVLAYTMRGKNVYVIFKNTFSFGAKKFLKVIQSIAAITVLFLIIDQILRLPYIRSDPFVIMVLGSILFMPAIVYARILLFRTTELYFLKESVKHRKK